MAATRSALFSVECTARYAIFAPFADADQKGNVGSKTPADVVKSTGAPTEIPANTEIVTGKRISVSRI